MGAISVQKWIMSGLLVVAGIFAVVLLTTGLPEKEPSAGEGTKFVVPEVAVDQDAVMQMYQSMCISCHGDQLQGGAGPALAQVGASMTKEQIYRKVANGGGGMPSFGKRLSEDELVVIANWLASKK